MAGGANTDPEGMITEINVTPLVDIILVLLIIFMLTANLIMRPSIMVELPKASTGEATEPTSLGFTITKDGSLYLNGQLTDEENLASYLADVVRTDPKAQAIIAADQEVTHGRVVHLIDLVRQAGIYKFALNIDPTAGARLPQP